MLTWFFLFQFYGFKNLVKFSKVLAMSFEFTLKRKKKASKKLCRLSWKICPKQKNIDLQQYWGITLVGGPMKVLHKGCMRLVGLRNVMHAFFFTWKRYCKHTFRKYPDDEVGSIMITNLLHLLALPLTKTLHIDAGFEHKCFCSNFTQCVSEIWRVYILCVQMMSGQGEPTATTLVPFSPSWLRPFSGQISLRKIFNLKLRRPDLVWGEEIYHS
jgi:hypothetical protein